MTVTVAPGATEAGTVNAKSLMVMAAGAAAGAGGEGGAEVEGATAAVLDDDPVAAVDGAEEVGALDAVPS